MRKMLSMIALTLAACAAHAQGFYYQSTMPDGHIIVGDKPAPGAKEVKQIPLRAGNIAAPVKPPPQAGPAPGGDAPQAADSSVPDVRTAQQQLDAAKAAVEAGREPLPGERLGTAGGKSRLTDAYFERQKALAQAVATAQKRLDDAAQRNPAR